MILVSTTLAWYWSSSRNAVATQKLVEELSSPSSSSSSSTFSTSSPAAIGVSLTAFQLVLGYIASSVVLFLLKPIIVTSQAAAEKDVDNDRPTVAEVKSNWKRDDRDVLVGCLHCVGCLCTNMGFVHGSSSLVQTIKLLEPMETLALMVFLNFVAANKKSSSIPSVIPLRKWFAMILILSGTSRLLAQKSIEINYQSVAFALASGLAMSCRNVVTKHQQQRGGANKDDASLMVVSSQQRLPSLEPKTSLQEQKQKNWLEKTHVGVEKFSRITVPALIPSVMLLVMVEGFGAYYSKESGVGFSSIRVVQSSAGLSAVAFHAAYNMASIVVLSLVTAPTHSLLNVGKRIVNVLVAAAVFGTPLGHKGVQGLATAAVGGMLYAMTPKRPWTTTSVNRNAFNKSSYPV